MCGMTDSDSGSQETPLWNFRLGFGPFTPQRPNDANYSAYMRLKTAPPAGCTFREDYGGARLECKWPGQNRLTAVGQLVRKIRTDHGLPGTDDLGIRWLSEWDPADREWAECTVGQLLLMGTGRAEQLGFSVEDVVAFVRDAMAPVSPPRQPPPRPRPDPDPDPADADDPQSGSAAGSRSASGSGSSSGSESGPGSGNTAGPAPAGGKPP